jgi:hypothetical protein
VLHLGFNRDWESLAIRSKRIGERQVTLGGRWGTANTSA